MHFNAKVALLLLGMLAGGVAGHLTMPVPVEIVRIGGAPDNPAPMPPVNAGGLLAQESGRILIFAACGGIIGLLAGFAAGRL